MLFGVGKMDDFRDDEDDDDGWGGRDSMEPYRIREELSSVTSVLKVLRPAAKTHTDMWPPLIEDALHQSWRESQTSLSVRTLA